MMEVTEIFEHTSSGFVRKILKSGGVVLGIKMENFKGKLVEDKKYAYSLADKVKKESGVGGFISTDELPAMGITMDEKKMLEEKFNCSDNDVVVFVIDQRQNKDGYTFLQVNDATLPFKDEA